MAVSKRTRSRSRKTSALQFTRFPEVAGKRVEQVEIDPDVNSLTIMFDDKTALSFDLDPMLVVFPELANLRTGNWRSIKKWRPLKSKLSMIEWP